MGRLRLIIGPPGSGKTHLLLSEIAAEAARAPLGPPAAPPLVLLVPEQQAAQMERAVLEHTGGVNSRVQVLSFRWLARRLELATGQARGELSETGRRLLVWKLLGEVGDAQFTDPAVRTETAGLLSGLLGQLTACGATAGQLRARIHALAQQHPQLASKAALLADLAQRFAEHCLRSGLHYTTPPARIPELLHERTWPLLSGTQVWIDGFSSFTPAEELALAALLELCASVTASLLLDPERSAGPMAHDFYDWYAPTREQFLRWGQLAAKAGIAFTHNDVTELDLAQRWLDKPALRYLAVNGLQPAAGGEPPVVANAVNAVVCADERAEVEAAVREVRRLVLPQHLGGAGLRYGQISVAMRSLAPYSGLLGLAFAEHGIPHFIDERRPLAHHPACELLRCGLRLALDCAERDDVYTLLKCDLLGLDAAVADRTEVRRRADLLENYARAVGLRPAEWTAGAAWQRAAGDERRDHSAELAQLDAWRRELLAPVFSLRGALAGLARPDVQTVLEQAWAHLFGAAVRAELQAWAEGAEPDQAELHRNVPQPLADLFDELIALAGTLPLSDLSSAYADSITSKGLCRWLEDGLNRLSLGFPPPRLDSVLVTDIARGRHHQVAATLLLGLADDSWPPPGRPGAYFSDAERGLLNAGGGRVLPGGALEDSRAEPYLALVACTRPAQWLWLSRPAADSEGRGRAPSPFFAGITAALGLTEKATASHDCGIACITSAADLVIAAALAPGEPVLQTAARAVSSTAPDAWRGLQWARGRVELPPLTPDLAAQLMPRDAGTPELDIRELEALGACPFKHFVHWRLGLGRRPQATGAPPLGRLYPQLLQRMLQLLRDTDYDWTARRPDPVREAANRALAELAERLALHGAGALHVLARANWLLARLSSELLDLPAGRLPLLLRTGYGAGQKFAPLVVETELGAVHIRGRIDRVDSDHGAATVVDLRLRAGEHALSWPRFLAGAELELPAALLAVGGHKLWDAERHTSVELHPDGAEVQRIEPRWLDDDAQFAPSRLRPDYARQADNAQLEPLVDNVLLETRRVLGELAQRALSGEVNPRPLRQGRWTACSQCGLRAVCRFDPAVGDEYREAHGTDAELRGRLAAGESFAGSAGVTTSEAAP